MKYYSDLCNVKKCLLFSQFYSLASLLSLAAYSKGRPPGSDREEKVYLALALSELNNAPRTSGDCLSHPGMNIILFKLFRAL